ncbi:2-haloacid dehalogenase [Dyadobacter jejuensis]|uniref:2-haloacid dehalogenase n=1 Tax=Dyadobacter jejuensis TaxID=1082580 RepID=A0A316ARV8_9BACT|nr:haloacid dehalogenase type II [Dyadobacter jejuensis]PWJ60248.1 2-haloacid dehalogenase [Dyadobacter jejuensis]
MNKNRREFMEKALKAGGIGMLASTHTLAQDENPQMARPKVLFFDVNETLLDLNDIKKSVGKALQGKTELLPLWFTTMLQYSLVETVGNRYHDFGTIGAAALQMVAANQGIALSDAQAKEAIKPILSLSPYPEVKAALEALKIAGYTLVSLTNSSSKGVEAQLSHAGLSHVFDKQLSIEEIGKYKPHADVYNWAARKMGVAPSDCLLVAAHGWDVAGALWAGWRAAFVSRPGQQIYPLAPATEITAPNLKEIAHALISLPK